MNAFDSIGVILVESLEAEPLVSAFLEQSAIASPWNLHWTEAAVSGGGLELDDPVFGYSWTKYWGVHTWFDCDPELHCECEVHNCL